MLFSIPGGGSSCSEAYVEILANEGVSISLGRFCGSSIPSPITSSTNKIKVVFHGGTTLTGFVGGFGLSYESVNLEGMLENKLPLLKIVAPRQFLVFVNSY